MPSSVLLIALFTATFAALAAAMVVMRRRQAALVRQREALQKQRGAAHIRATALAAYAHTGRADIAIMLLQLSCEMLEEAVQLAPDEVAVAESLRNLHELMDSLQVDDRPAKPVPNPESQSELTQASMQLTEATRLLVRLEVRAELESAELRSMQSELRRVQRSLEFRTRMRRELEAPSVMVTAPELEADALLAAQSTETPAHFSPSH